MKKFFSLAAIALFACAFTFVSCGEEDSPMPKTEENIDTGNKDTGETPTTDLVGTWEQKGEQVKLVYTFTKDQLTSTRYDLRNGSWILPEGGSSTVSYTYKDGILSYKENDQTVERAVNLLYDKTVLVLLSKDNQDEIEGLMYKKDATISATLDKLQGDWRCYMDDDATETRVAVRINGNHISLIPVGWGQRYDGNITSYTNGYINFEVTEAFTSREEGTGEGWGNGELDPVTLEANWKTLNFDSWMFVNLQSMPFIATGDMAYGIFANSPGIYHKKQQQ